VDIENAWRCNEISNVREIIFSPEFIEKLERYIMDKTRSFPNSIFNQLVKHKLDNPVDYLFSLIKE